MDFWVEAGILDGILGEFFCGIVGGILDGILDFLWPQGLSADHQLDRKETVKSFMPSTPPQKSSQEIT